MGCSDIDVGAGGLLWCPHIAAPKGCNSGPQFCKVWLQFCIATSTQRVNAEAIRLLRNHSEKAAFLLGFTHTTARCSTKQP